MGSTISSARSLTKEQDALLKRVRELEQSTPTDEATDEAPTVAINAE
jgi:hypothetical protein